MKKSLWCIAILGIIIMLFTSCRYEEKRSLKSQDINPADITWQKVITDSVRNNIIHYFVVIVGKDDCPTMSKVYIHKYYHVLQVPDSLLKNIPTYYDCFYLGEPMIFEQEVHRISGPTLWKAPQVIFTIKVMDPVTFGQSSVQIVTRDAETLWQVVIVVCFLFFGILSFVLLDDDDDAGGMICCALVTLVMLYLSWCYLPYFVSGLLSFLLLAAIVCLFAEPIGKLLGKLIPKKGEEF